MKAGAVWVLGLTGLVALGAVGLYRTLPNVESDVRASVTKALADKGFSDVRADVSGQTVTLSVGDTVPDPANHLAKARDIVTGLDGKVTQVKIVSISPSTPPQLAAANPSSLVAPLAAPAGVISGEKATTIALANSKINGGLPAVAGDSAQDAATEAARTCEDRITAAVGSRKIDYRFGTYDLTSDSEPVLDDVYNALSGCPSEVKLVVAGYTDNVGDPAANRLISETRARRAADALIKRGLAADRITVVGLGGTAPIAEDATPEGRAANRRIVFRTSAG
ncbi:MAG: OmpA family protein [Asticcacaulis sp.]|nr:OmpA family protein [Asticcacaulis sp.]